MSTPISPSIRALLADHEIFHSDFQMDRFITIRSGGTPYGCYKQALRELYKRVRGLRQVYSDRALLQTDIDELEASVTSWRRFFRSRFDRRRAEINLASKRLAVEEADRVIRDTEREFLRFHAQASALKKEIGELTPEKRDRLDREMWAHNLKAAAALELITTGRVGHNTVMFIQAGPKEWRVPLLAEVLGGEEANRTLIDWFVNHEQGFQLPPPTAEPADVRRLLE